MINIIGLALIFAIVWWFWLYQPEKAQVTEGGVTVIVENGTYQPAHIKLPVNQAATIKFLRKDTSPCAAMVVFPDFDISEELPLNKIKEVHLPAMKAGKYAFTCQMQMYRGDIVVDA